MGLAIYTGQKKTISGYVYDNWKESFGFVFKTPTKTKTPNYLIVNTNEKLVGELNVKTRNTLQTL